MFASSAWCTPHEVGGCQYSSSNSATLVVVRWPGNGSLQTNENLILYSGLPTQQPDNRRSGVAIALGEEAIKAWKAAGAECDPISDRLLKARFKIHTGHLSVFAVYAPTNEEAQTEASEKFYEELQEAVCGVPRQDMLVIMGDFNARVGCDDEAWHGVIGRNGPNEKNSNGDRLLDFCALNNLVVTNTTFKHRPINTPGSILLRKVKKDTY